MIIFPAIDIQKGKAVRLKQGKADHSTIFSEDPISTALAWQKAGATWLHIIDLDGAFEGKPTNQKLIKQICSAVSIPVQLGGGIRDINTATAYLDAGVTRLIIGTMALENPDLFEKLCNTFPNSIGVSLDSEAGTLKTKGWVNDSGLNIENVLPSLIAKGAAFIIYTDIERDGMQTGLNINTLTSIATLSTIPVIAAGGVSCLDDIIKLYPLSKSSKLIGAISGKAIYEGTLNLSEAIQWIKSQK